MNEQCTQPRWDTELFIVRGGDRDDLIRNVRALATVLERDPEIDLKDLAYTLNIGLQDAAESRLAVAAVSREELAKKLAFAISKLDDPECTRIMDRSGIFYFDEPLGREGGLAFLFPGEGSQYPSMLGDLCIHFPEVRRNFDRADHVWRIGDHKPIPSTVLFAPPVQTSSQSAAGEDEEDIWQMDLAVTAVFNSDLALFHLIMRLGIEPDAVIGHSSGEFGALIASGAAPISGDDQLIDYSLTLRNISRDSATDLSQESYFLTAGGADPTIVRTCIEESGGALSMAMDNCPNQVVMCGSKEAVDKAFQDLAGKGAICSVLPFGMAYHTPAFRPFCDNFTQFFNGIEIVAPKTTIYSCATAQPYPSDPDGIRKLAVDQWAEAVRFREAIENMHDAGIRIFLEVGPRDNLTGFVNDILGKRPFLATPSNVPYRTGIAQLCHVLGLLAAHGVAMDLEYLYARRSPEKLDLEGPPASVEEQKKRKGILHLSNDLPKMTLDLSRLQLSGPASRKAEPAAGLAAGAEPSPASAPAAESVPGRVAAAETGIEPETGPMPLRQNGHRVRIMQEYLETMERFLVMQQDVMAAFQARRRKAGPEDPTAPGDSS